MARTTQVRASSGRWAPVELRARDVDFAVRPGVALAWHPTLPELAYAANSISLLMPHVEPYIVRSVRAVLPELDEPLRSRTRAYLDQELAHHVQHRRFNDDIASQCPGVTRLERWMRRTYGWLGRTRSREFNVAFAASSETIAFAIARWIDRNVGTLFDGADPTAAGLYLWHLAEEVEHKAAADEVHRAIGASRWRYVAASIVTLGLLVAFSFAGTVLMLRAGRRLLSPVAWFRLTRWSLSLAFTVLPMVATSWLPGHDPSALADPGYLTQWLRGLDAHGAAVSVDDR